SPENFCCVDIRQIHARLKMRSYAAEVFWAVLPRKSFLKLKARSRAPEFAYINAPPAPYKGIQPQSRVHTESTSRIKVMSKQKANTGGAPASKHRPNFTGAEVEVEASKHRPNFTGAEVEVAASKHRPNFTGAEVEVLLQNVDVECSPLYSTMAISMLLSLVLIYLFTAICSVRVVLLFILGHHGAS